MGAFTLFLMQAIENLKATAGGLPRENNLGSEPPKVSQTRSSSTLPADFFDGQGAKRQKTGKIAFSAWPLEKFRC